MIIIRLGKQLKDWKNGEGENNMDLDDEELEATRTSNGASRPKNTSTERIWRTKEGKSIKVKDMTTQHIINTLNAIEDGKIQFVINMRWAQDNDYIEYDENTEAKKRWIKVFKDELKRRKGEIK